MTTWREEFDEIFDPTLYPISNFKTNSVLARNNIKAFISQILKAAFNEVKGNLPKEKDNDYKDVEDYDIRCQEGVDFDKGYNQCLADIKANIKKTKEKFL